MVQHIDSVTSTVISAGIAGMTADLSLHPLDTIKTRMQSTQGFWRAGGFRGLYKGLSVVTIGSAPESALFFCTYEACKQHLSEKFPTLPHASIHMGAATVAEVIACSVRVPTEVIKQRMQMGKGSLGGVVGSIWRTEGLSGMFTGFGATIMREIPYALIQFPLYEFFMDLAENKRGKRPESLEAAFYGSVSGAIAAGITTPLDVVKTRMMLAERGSGVQFDGIGHTLVTIVKQEGPSALLKGLVARVAWIGLGGFVLFGAYEQSKKMISILNKR